MPSDDWNSDEVRKVLINPMYCLSTPPVISEGQSIEANAQLIRELGPEECLRERLDTKKTSFWALGLRLLENGQTSFFTYRGEAKVSPE
jgi:hypothetical protein